MKLAWLTAVKTIVSHGSCPDGIASAMLLHDALPDARVVMLEHNTPEQRALAATPGMLFCDIAPPEQRAGEFVRAQAIVLDHHKGARDIVTSFGERGVFADEKLQPGVSGALLAYEEVWRVVHGKEDPARRRFAELAGVRDTWQKHHPDWSLACAQASALLFYDYEALAGRALPSEDQLAVGELLIAKRLAAAATIAKKKCYRLNEQTLIYNDRDRLLSDVAEAAFNDDAGVNVVCGFHYKVLSDGNMLLVCAMRSRRDGVDVSAIAKAHGGGGHSSAAGFSLPLATALGNPIEVLRPLLTDV